GAYPGNRNLPFCNPNLGSEVCIYGGGTSFCSKPCAADAECGELAGGCCRDLGKGETYCMTKDYCAGSGPVDAGVSTDPGVSDPGSTGGEGDGPDGRPTEEADDEGDEGAASPPEAGVAPGAGGCGVSARAASPWELLVALGAAALVGARARRARSR